MVDRLRKLLDDTKRAAGRISDKVNPFDKDFQANQAKQSIVNRVTDTNPAPQPNAFMKATQNNRANSPIPGLPMQTQVVKPQPFQPEPVKVAPAPTVPVKPEPFKPTPAPITPAQQKIVDNSKNLQDSIVNKAKEVRDTVKMVPRGLQIAVTSPFMSDEEILRKYPELAEMSPEEGEAYAKRVAGGFFDLATLGLGGAELKATAKAVGTTGKIAAKEIGKRAGVRAVEGAAYGGVRSASQGDNIKEVIANTGVGAVGGGVLGAAELPVARTMNKGGEKVQKVAREINRDADGNLRTVPGYVRIPGKPTELMVVHNTNANKLAKATELGGMPQPSIGIVDPKVGTIEGFGDITLVGNENLVRPSKTTRTYGADIYSPRQPHGQYLSTRESLNSIEQAFGDYFKKTNDKLGIYSANEDLVGAMENNAGVMAKFLEDLALQPNIPVGDGIDVRNALRRQIMDNDLGDKFYNYVIDKVKASGATSKIFAGYTNTGRKRLLDDTLDNALKVMRQEGKRGQDTFGSVGAIRAQFTPEFKSLEEMVNNKNRLVGGEVAEKFKTELTDKLFALQSELDEFAVNRSSNSFTETDRQLDAITDYLKGKTSYFDAKFVDVPAELKAKIKLFKKELQSAPTEYFESVSDRAVTLNEFEKALVPEGTSPETLNSLRNQGIEPIFYKEGQRQQTLQKLMDEDNQARGFGAAQTPKAKNPLEIARTPQSARIIPTGKGKSVVVAGAPDELQGATATINKKTGAVQINPDTTTKPKAIEPDARPGLPAPRQSNEIAGLLPSSDEASVRARVAENLELKKQNLETRLYGSPTVVEGGTKGAGKIGGVTREVQNRTSEMVAKGLESDNVIVRNIAGGLRAFFGQSGNTAEQASRLGRVRGAEASSTQIANDLDAYVRQIVGNNDESLKRIHAVMDPELSGLKISPNDLTNEEARALTALREASDYINDQNFINGFISKETWEKGTGGRYIARAYDEFDLPDELKDTEAFKAAKGKLDLGAFKQRGEVDEWKLDHKIDDPSYLVGKRLQQTVRNTEIKNYMDWVGAQPGMTSDIARPGYTQLSDSKMWGNLAGKYVRQDVLEGVRGFYSDNKAVQGLMDLLNWYDRTAPRRFMKKTKTVYNPATRLGNQIGNRTFALISGINPFEFEKNVQTYAKKALADNTPEVRLLRENGVIGSDYARKELVNTLATKGDKAPGVIRKADDFITETYSNADDHAKIAAFKYWLDKGKTTEEALEKVKRSFQDYNTVGKAYDFGAKVPVFGNAFVRFQGDLVRILKNAALENPLGVAGVVGGIYAAGRLASALSGESEEDRITREGRMGMPVIPFTDIPLAFQTPWGEVNAARLFGIYNLTPAGGESSAKNALFRQSPIQIPTNKQELGAALTSDPLIGPAIGVAANIDFRGKSVRDPDENKYQPATLTPGEQNMNRAEYLGRSYNLPLGNDIINLFRSFQGKPTIYGKEQTPTQAALRLAGVKTEQFGPEQAQETRDRDAMFATKKQEAIQKQINQVQKDAREGKIDAATAQKRIQNLQKGAAPTGNISAQAAMQIYGYEDLENAGAGIKKVLKDPNITPEAREQILQALSSQYVEDLKAEFTNKKSGISSLIQEDKKWDKAAEIFGDDELPDDVKESVYKALNVDKAELEYGFLAKQETDVKSDFLIQQAQQMTPDQFYDELVKGRAKSRSNDRFAADSVLDNLYNAGVISYEERKALKALDYDRKTGKSSVKRSARGGRKAKKIKLYNPLENSINRASINTYRNLQSLLGGTVRPPRLPQTPQARRPQLRKQRSVA